MSYSTWHFITPSPSLEWLFRNMVLPRFVSMWQKCWENICMIWLQGNIVTKWVLHQYSTAYTSTLLVPTTYTQLSPVTLSTTLTTSTVILLVAHHLATESRLRPFLRRRTLTAASSSVLPPSRWPIPAGRRGLVRTAVLPPRFNHAMSVRYWPTWATFSTE